MVCFSCGTHIEGLFAGFARAKSGMGSRFAAIRARRAVSLSVALALIVALGGCGSKKERAQAYYRQGVKLIASQKFPAAVAYFDSALQLNPRYVDAIIRKGDVYCYTHRPQDAVGLYERALALDARNVAAVVGRAQALMMLESPVEARRAFERALALTEHPDSVLVIQGWAEFAAKRRDDARATFHRATKINPNNSDAWLAVALAGITAHISRPMEVSPEALPALDRALKLKPDDIAVLTLKAVVLDALGRYDDEQALYDTLLALEKTNKPGWYTFRSNLAVKTGRESVWYSKGATFRKLRRFDDAIAACDSSLALNPQNPATWELKANLVEKMGRKKEAETYYERADSLSALTPASGPLPF